MTKESVKKFIKDHKAEISGTIALIGMAALIAIGVKNAKELQTKDISMLSDDKLFIDLVNTVDEASAGSTKYVKLTLSEIAAAISNSGGAGESCVVDPDGNTFEIKNLIAFGNIVEP